MAIKQKLISLVVCLALAGCSPLAPRPNYAKYFVLTPVTDTANAVSANSKLSIGLGPIDFPGYLQRTQVVTRSAATQIDLSPIDRWGEPLDKNFKRVLAENLTRLLGTYRIEEYPWSHEAKVDYQVTIQVENFETTSDHQSLLRARWIIKSGTDGRDLYASETTASTPVEAGDTGMSAALSSDLGTLSRAIAVQISALGRPAMAPT
jgi:uncharacterized lipoprotein YmbA